mgnify:FL=1
MASRIEGQIWLSRDNPVSLKYYARSKEYWVVSASTYAAGEQIYKGTILTVSKNTGGTSTDEKVVAAQWPLDASSVVGIALNSADINTPVRIVSYGYIKLDATDLANAFVTKSDFVASAALSGTNYYVNFGNTSNDGGAGNGWNDTTGWNGRGAPVYWFPGRILKTSTGYSWKDPSLYRGKLTIATPSGYAPTGTEIPWNDDSLNIDYEGLPCIGTVVSYTYDANKIVTSLILHVNFSTFKKEIKFGYPRYSTNNNIRLYSSVNDPQIISLRHGLFPDSVKAQTDIIMIGYSDSTPPTGAEIETYRMFPGYDSYITTDSRRTDIEISSDTSFYYKIIGTVSYC